MKKLSIIIIIFLTSCTNFNTGNYCGGFPRREELRIIDVEDLSNGGSILVENFAKLNYYMNATEKAKMECKYVK